MKKRSPAMTASLKITILIFCISVLGVVFSSILLKQHFANKTSSENANSICNINEVINCDLVDASEFSELYGMPVSGISPCFYVSLSLFLLYAILKKKQHPIVFSFLMSLLGALFTLRMAYLSFVSLRLVCLFCVGLYIVNLSLIVLFFVALGGLRKTYQNLRTLVTRSAFTTLLPYILCAVLIMALGLGFIYERKQNIIAQQELQTKANVQKQAMQSQEWIEELSKAFFQQAQVAFDFTGHAVKGNPDAGVQVVIFSDFECPFCKVAAQKFAAYVKENPESIALYYFNYPLDTSCNKYIKNPKHKSACLAAKASACADAQENFWEYHDELFANQPRFDITQLKSYAHNLGLNASAFATCLQKPNFPEEILRDVDLGKELKIHGTPAVFINGRPLAGWQNAKLLHTVIERLRQQK